MNVEEFLKSRARGLYSREFAVSKMSKSTVDEIINWCNKNKIQKFKYWEGIYTSTWQFDDDNDATLFALRWSNYFNREG